MNSERITLIKTIESKYLHNIESLINEFIKQVPTREILNTTHSVVLYENGSCMHFMILTYSDLRV